MRFRPPVPPQVLLCDRDGTLIEDVPYNDDPAAVTPLEGVRESLDRARAAGLRVAVVTNQSGVARGLIEPERLDGVHRRVVELLGPFDAILTCPHDDGDGCACRKPKPGLVQRAADLLGVPTEACVMVGDTAADVAAALAAGANGVLVPNSRTMPDDIEWAPRVEPTFPSAVDRVLHWHEART